MPDLLGLSLFYIETLRLILILVSSFKTKLNTSAFQLKIVFAMSTLRWHYRTNTRQRLGPYMSVLSTTGQL